MFLRELLPWLYEPGMLSVLFRLILATVLGGVIGIERGQKRRPAGFRTYMLVCIGAALAMMTNEYTALFVAGSTDVSRIGAGVISGVGFLGAGTIIVTKYQQVKGLTTAAGIWASASMGLAIGIGYYEAALVGFLLIISTMTILHKVDSRVYSHSKVLEIYVEFENTHALKDALKTFRSDNIQMTSMDIIKSRMGEDATVCVIMTLKQPTKMLHQDLIAKIAMIMGISFVEEL